MRNGYCAIATYANPVEAEMALERLRSCGLDAELSNGSAASSLYGAGNPIMNQSLFVEIERAGEARELLRGIVMADAGVESANDAAPAEEADAGAGPSADGLNAREQAAETAYRAAIVGWLVPLISWYALWKLGDVVMSAQPMGARSTRRAIIAAVFSLLPAFGWAVTLALLMRGLL